MDKRQIKRLEKKRNGLLSAGCLSGYTGEVRGARTVENCGCKLCLIQVHQANRITQRITTLSLSPERQEYEDR